MGPLPPSPRRHPHLPGKRGPAAGRDAIVPAGRRHGAASPGRAGDPRPARRSGEEKEKEEKGAAARRGERRRAAKLLPAVVRPPGAERGRAPRPPCLRAGIDLVALASGSRSRPASTYRCQGARTHTRTHTHTDTHTHERARTGPARDPLQITAPAEQGSGPARSAAHAQPRRRAPRRTRCFYPRPGLGLRRFRSAGILGRAEGSR